MIVPVEHSMSDPSKIRRFRCPDALWETYERLAAELDQSLDELITGALVEHARRRASPAPESGSVGSARAAPRSEVRSPSSPPAPRRAPSSVPPRGSARTALASPLVGGAVPRRPSTAPPPGRSVPAPSTLPRVAGGPLVSSLPVPARAVALTPPPPPQRSAVPPPPPPVRGPSAVPGLRPPSLVAPAPRFAASTPPAPPVRAPAPTLWITYAGARFPVHKDRFVIGRVKNASDLVIKDPNVSRHHAIIERRGTEFVLQDLGSTNGIVFRGERVARRILEDGDAVYVGDHELRFSFE